MRARPGHHLPEQRLATNVPHRWRMASIASHDAMILPQRANPFGWNFREGPAESRGICLGARVLAERAPGGPELSRPRRAAAGTERPRLPGRAGEGQYSTRRSDMESRCGSSSRRASPGCVGIESSCNNWSTESVTITLARCRVRFGFQPDAYNKAK
jgi:hypothetical protein